MGCASSALQPFTTETTPVLMVPALQSEAQDRRGRFREIFCAVLEARKDSLPDYRSCDSALITVGDEPHGSGRPVNLGTTHRRLKAVFVPGLGWNCFSNWLEEQDSIPLHLRKFGYDMAILDVHGLSSSRHNAQLIRDEILTIPEHGRQPNLVFVGYSKGAVDVLTAVTAYPEIRRRVTAMASVAGAVGGSPLANDASDNMLDMMQHFPGATCKSLGGSALKDLRPETRKAWLAKHTLPGNIAYYSMITFPEPDRISSILRNTYHTLSQIDARNDSQVIFYDQFIPGSALVACFNADHWAVGVPIARTHGVVGTLLVDKNAFPREAMYESLLRLVEEDLQIKEGTSPNHSGSNWTDGLGP